MKNTWKIYMLSIVSFLLGSSQFVIVGILDQVADSVGVSVSTAGQLITAFALANAIGTPSVIMATSKWDQRKQLLLSLFILLIGIILTVSLQGFIILMISRIILGVGSGVFVVTAYSIAAKLAPPGREVGAMSNVVMGFSAALVFGVPIGRVIASAYDWKVIFWAIGLLTIMAILAVAKMIPATESTSPVPIGEQLSFLKKPRIAVALTVTFFMFISYSVVNTYITPLLTTVLPNGEHVISVILFALGIASLIGSKLGGFLADRIGVGRTLVGGMSMQTLSLALLSIFRDSVLVTTVFLMIWMISAWTFGSPQNFNLVSLAPNASGIMLSLNSSFVQLGFATGAVLGGTAIGTPSIMVITWIGASSVAIAATIAFVSFSRVRPLSSVQR